MSLVVVSRGPLLRGALGAGLALLAIALGAPAATAATFTVSTTADGTGTCTAAGPCSLRQALDSAGNGDTVAVPAGTYTLNSANGQLNVSTGVTIDGAGQGSTMIVGPGNDRVMMIAGNATTVTISGLTITGGDTTSSGGGGIAAAGPGRVVLDDDTVAHNTVAPAAAGFDEGGGGILTSADMVLNQTTVSDNTVDVTASNGDSGGGGILVEQGGGTLTLNDSTITANTATVAANTAGETADNNGGGGIYMDGLDLTIDNSTVSQNTVTVTGSAQPAPADGGGGIYQFGDNLLLENSTVSGNSASGPGVAKGGGGGVFDGGNTSQYLNSTIASNSTDEPAAVGTPDTDGGGGVLLDNVIGGVVMANMTITGNSASQAAGGAINNNLITEVEISDSIVAGNSEAGDAHNNCDSQTAGANAIVSEGYNLTDDGSCGFTATGDIVTANPLVGSLHGNGGPAETEALLAGSPAIDGGNPAGCTDLAGNLLTTDERGVSRPQPPGGRCDIGAYERALPIVSTSNAAVTGTTVLFGAMVSNPDPRAANGQLRIRADDDVRLDDRVAGAARKHRLADAHRLGLRTLAGFLPLPRGRDRSRRNHARPRLHVHDRRAAVEPAAVLSASVVGPAHPGRADRDRRQADPRRGLHRGAHRDGQPERQDDLGAVPVRHHDELQRAYGCALGRRREPPPRR